MFSFCRQLSGIKAYDEKQAKKKQQQHQQFNKNQKKNNRILRMKRQSKINEMNECALSNDMPKRYF